MCDGTTIQKEYLPLLAPTESDYELNGGLLSIIFPANETRLKIPLTIVDDGQFESSEEDLTITFSARVDTADLTADIPVRPDNTTIRIVDNDGGCVSLCGIVC